METNFAAIDSIVLTKNICFVNIDIEDLNHQHSESICQACLTVLNNIDIKMLALNFSNIKTLSTSGIKGLLDIYYCLDYYNKTKLYIYNANKKIKQIFKETTVDSLLWIS